LWVLAVLLWWVRYHPPGVDLLVVEDDARQHVYWTARFQDPALFRDDLQTAFISSPMFAPLGYRALYSLGVPFMDPLPFSQLVTLVLLLTSLGLLDALARGIIADPRGRFFLCGLFLFFSLYDASGGFPRNFAFPLLLGFLVLVGRGRFRWGAGVLVLEALFYPPILLNTMLLAGWDLLRRFIQGARDRRWWGDSICLAVAAAAALSMLIWVYAPGDQTMPGKQVTLEQAREMPEFHEGGRSKFFRKSALAYWLVGRSGVGAIHLIGFAIILSIMAVGMRGRGLRLPPLAIDLCWTSLLLFGAAHLLLFRLHLPSRYTLYTLPLAFMLTIGANTGLFVDRMRPLWESVRRRLMGGPAPRGAGWLAFGLLLAVYVYVQSHHIARVDTQMAALDPLDREMLAFVGTLPKETLVAAHPVDADNIPLLSRRKVLVNRELSLPYYVGYYDRIRRRLSDVLQAYYAMRWEAVEALVERYGIGALVVRKERFQPPALQGAIYDEPFNRQVKANWRAGVPFVLADPPAERRCFENQRYVVLCWGKGT
jgi:hypothetical protein